MIHREMPKVTLLLCRIFIRVRDKIHGPLGLRTNANSQTQQDRKEAGEIFPLKEPHKNIKDERQPLEPARS